MVGSAHVSIQVASASIRIWSSDHQPCFRATDLNYWNLSQKGNVLCQVHLSLLYKWLERQTRVCPPAASMCVAPGKNAVSGKFTVWFSLVLQFWGKNAISQVCNSNHNPFVTHAGIFQTPGR